MTNFTTAIAASEVWFNTAYHRDSFLDALRLMLKKMPDYNSLDYVDQIRAKSHVVPQGIEPMPKRQQRLPGPPRILWVARWESDKNPEMFFEALFRLLESGVEFQVDVIGQQFERVPEIFEQARTRLGDRIGRWGYQPTRDDYVRALGEADIVVSTADHEFFGVSIVEAVSAGAFPLLPQRLSYPELFGLGVRPESSDFFYDGTLKALVSRLRELCDRTIARKLWDDNAVGRRIVEAYHWDNLVPRLDDAAERVAG
jgi:glycosyltransferase involved in cell wall biosynthesis